ncbi:hypothetical protein [Bacillus sp. FJAT-47783]|uniref:hypothetical protein n=1 Tax=Bacillus sp. FJAT-47783 TaxID=2922712 RepID=UPI001FABE1D5|nr:hypothetical protein [Bacillus sp. FJAT-47783]
MQKISSGQFEFLTRFYYLLDSIEEGFDYVLLSFENIHCVDRDQVLADIMLAIYEIDSARSILNPLLTEESKVKEDFHQLDDIIHQFEEIEFIKSQPVNFEHFIKCELYPTFMAWKQQVQKRLHAYIAH